MNDINDMQIRRYRLRRSLVNSSLSGFCSPWDRGLRLLARLRFPNDLSQILPFWNPTAAGSHLECGRGNRQSKALRTSGLSFTVLLSFLLLGNALADDKEYDVVVYGGTSAAVSCAVQVKRMSKSVIVVSPDTHLGGLSSGGLGWTDTGNKSVIGGLAREFYHRVYLHYDSPEAWRWQSREDYGNKGQGTPAIDGDKRTMWIFEPHVAERIFETWISENDITVRRGEWLDREDGVVSRDGRIQSIRTLSGETYRSRMFVDATYEGDLLAAAKVSYHVGREANATYGEEWNGVQVGVLHHGHHFKKPVDPYRVPGDPSSGLLSKISADLPGKRGEADKRVQAYCFRMCLSRHPDNRIPFEKPVGYNPADYELLARVFASGWRETFNKFDPVPNLKTDTNNHGPFSTDNIGKNHDYPEASYARRREIIAEHEQYQKGLMYFLANDPKVPVEVREEMARWGLAKDEFTDNGGWPHQIYVREARRMVGEFVMTEHEVLNKRPVPDSVGMGSYTLDSHNVQRYVKPDGFVQNEGDIGVRTNGPYRIAYRSLAPKQKECGNLLVPVCVSSSHIAFGSIRMEPVFMILGQSAATAAVMAIDADIPVQQVPYARLRVKLLADGQILEATGASLPGTDPSTLQGIVVDDLAAELTGKWTGSRSVSGFVAHGYQHNGDGSSSASAVFKPKLTAEGKYEVRIAYPAHGNRAANVLVVIAHADGIAAKRIDQRKVPPIKKQWLSLGVYDFNKTNPATVTISNSGAKGYVVIDAVQFLKKEN